MRASRWTFVVMALSLAVAAGCGDEGGGGVLLQDTADSGTGSGDVGLDAALPDMGQPDDTVEADAGTDTGADTAGDTSGGDAVTGSDADAQMDTVEDTASDAGDDAGDDTGTGDPDADAGGPDDITAPPTDLPEGAACGAALGTCAAGLSCLPTATGAATSQCYAPVGPGELCGPGKGGCADGLVCQSQAGAEAVCIDVLGAGEPCDGPGLTCGPGLLCGDSATLIGYEPMDAWTPAPDFDPARMAHDVTGRLLVIDNATSRIIAFKADGTVAQAYGDAEAGVVTKLTNPVGVTAGPGDRIFVVDATQQRVIGYALDGSVTAIISQPGPDVSQFQGVPDDVASPPDQTRLYVSEPSQNRVKVFNKNGNFVAHVGSQEGDGQLTSPSGVWAEDDALWVVDASARVLKWDATLVWQATYDLPLTDAASEPSDLFVDEAGRIFVADAAGRVVVLAPDGAVFAELGAGEGLVAPRGVAPGPDGILFVSDSGKGEIALFAPAFEQVCVQPGALGTPCGAGIGPCIQGAICLPSTPGALTGTCKLEAVEGEDCSAPDALCAAGTYCVKNDFQSGPGATCLPPAPNGQPCGPGLASCNPGSGCAWADAQHSARICKPSAALGAACDVYGVGGCVEGATCEATQPSTYDYVCTALRAEGETCGHGIGTCGAGLGCAFDDVTLETKSCYPLLSENAPCELIGTGPCGPATECIFVDSTFTTAACLAEEGPGATCGVTGVGLCAPGSDCLPETPVSTDLVCKPADSPVGEVCALGGAPLCADGADCLITDMTATSAVCYADQPNGASCGAGVGLCAAGSDCVITDDVNLLGQCLPAHAPGMACSVEEGLCDDGGTCVCSNPFADPCPSTVCVPPVGPWDLCVVNSAVKPIGWAGFCPDGWGCNANDVDFIPGGTTSAQIETAYFRCRPLVLLGETCGPYAGACDVGLECRCGGVACSFDDIIAGTLGICDTATP